MNQQFDKLMGGAVNDIFRHQYNAMNKSRKLHKRLVHLENNESSKRFGVMLALKSDDSDSVASWTMRPG